MTLDEAREHVGGKVVYQPGLGPCEEGVITSVSERYVFVRYGSDVGAKATRPDWLALVSGGAQ